MSDFIPTKSQSQAIYTRGSTVLVSAGAGSGKTKVLTERLMAAILDGEHPADIDSFLIITYTRAAAGELRGRITEELAAALASDPSSRRLRRQNALCQRAHIGTIHSFCADLLREFSHMAGISPDFKILDEDRANAMKAAALERTLEMCYAKPEEHPGFTLLADTVGAGRDDRRLAALVMNLHGKMQCHARPAKWARQQVELLNTGCTDAAETPWGREIMDRVRESCVYWSGEMDRMMAEMAPYEKIKAAYMSSVQETAEAIRELLRCLDIGWDKARENAVIPFTRLGVLRNSPAPEVSELVKARREGCKKAMKTVTDTLSSDSAKLLHEMELTTPAMSALLELTLLFDREYAKDKRRSALVDYSDLEHLTAGLLTDEDGEPTELARQVAGRYTEIMVDEYQDVSQVQDAIFGAVSQNGKNLFLVGDVKQSIYRFRLADPAIFTEKYLRFADADKAAPGEAERIMLQENFRSRREILNAANAVFSRCMSRRLGDIDYDDAAALKYGADYEGSVPVPELLLMGLSAGEDGEAPDKTECEARMTAERIRALIESRELIRGKNGMRPVEYGDVAILLRSANTVGGVYRRALAERGIPVSSVQTGGYFTSVEISTIMSALAIIDNPHQDIPLIAVLRSPSFLFSADELSAIRAASRRGDFCTALVAAAEENEKCARFIEKLSAIRKAAPDMPVSELTWTVITELDMLAVCSAMSDSEQRRANLMSFVELSERFEATGYRGLHRFVLWLRQLAAKESEPCVGAPGASAVHIMSVHRSKGLEFPVVFLCDTARRFNKQDTYDTVLVHPELGLGPKVTDLARRVEYPSLARNAIKLRLERENLSEEMRLLYVAMTRPKERLYITAALKDPAKLVEKTRTAVTDPMEPELLSGASSPVEWLIAAALADGEQHLKLTYCLEGTATENRDDEADTTAADSDTLRELKRRLSFVYPYGEAVQLPSKVTATELKGRNVADEDAGSIAPKHHRAFRMPDFVKKDKPLTGTERGIATHLVLQYMDFAKTGSLAGIREEIERLREKRFISEREAEAVDAEAIEKLFASPLGRRMTGADRMLREFKFSVLCDAKDVFREAEGEQVLLQGVVDCCIEEDGALTVIDYKTDNVRTAAEIAERSRLYTPQLTAYADALERIYAMPVKECVLYFLSAGKAVSVTQK